MDAQHPKGNPKSRKPWSPTKGGDGGTAPRVTIGFVDSLGVLRNRSANGRQIQNCVAPDDRERLIPTAAVSDRSHDTKIGGMLRTSWIAVRGQAHLNTSVPSKARLYSAANMTGTNEFGQPVEFGTVIETTETARCRLAGQLQSLNRAQPDESEVCIHVYQALAQWEATHDQPPKAMRKTTLRGMTRDERKKDRQAEEWALKHGVNLHEPEAEPE